MPISSLFLCRRVPTVQGVATIRAARLFFSGRTLWGLANRLRYRWISS